MQRQIQVSHASERNGGIRGAEHTSRGRLQTMLSGSDILTTFGENPDTSGEGLVRPDAYPKTAKHPCNGAASTASEHVSLYGARPVPDRRTRALVEILELNVRSVTSPE